MHEELIRELRDLAARKWSDAPNRRHSLFGRAADALEGMLAAADSVLALGLEEDGATCDWPELQAAIKELRSARNGWPATEVEAFIAHRLASRTPEELDAECDRLGFLRGTGVQKR